MLADEGKLDWDDRVIDRMPEFRMSDAYVTREITIRDLLTHRSGMGLGAGDLMFFPDSDFTREQIIFNQRYIPLSTSFRSRHAYDNVLYVAAGQIIPKVTSKSWDDYLGAPPKDYIAAFDAVRTRREKEAKDTVAKASGARNRESRPSLPLEKYAGLYRDAWYGEATVGVVEGRLNLKFARSAGLNGALEHFQYDTFVVKWAERTVPDAYVTFSMESDGGIRDIRLKAVSPLADFSYDFQDLLFLPARR